MSIEITPEIRQAVWDEFCVTNGHDIRVTMAMTNEPVDPGDKNPVYKMEIRCSDPDKLPHLYCARCGRVWIVMDTPGTTYEQAFASMQSFVMNESQSEVAVQEPPTVKPEV